MAGETDAQLGGTEAFPNLGRHCSFPSCGQLDFLPFTCDGCKKTFCLEHRTFASHECPRKDYKETRVMICPICAKAVRHVFGEEADLTMDRHIRSNACDPSNYARSFNLDTKKKPCCPVKGCKQVLTISAKTRCKGCQIEVCLRHRFPDDHSCVAIKVPTLPLSGLLAQARRRRQGDGRTAGIDGRLLSSLSLGSRTGSECALSSKNIDSRQDGESASGPESPPGKKDGARPQQQQQQQEQQEEQQEVVPGFSVTGFGGGAIEAH